MIIPQTGSQTASDSPLLKSFTKTHCTKLVLITTFTRAIRECTLCSISLPFPPVFQVPTSFPEALPLSAPTCSAFGRIKSQSEQYFLKWIQWGFFFNKDLISRTATKQINCHALRAKKYPASLVVSSSSPYRTQTALV